MLHLALLLVAGLAVAVGIWWIFPPDPVTALRHRHSPLAGVERRPATELGAGVERWRLVTATGDTLTGLWRAASAGARSPWTVVMLGGLVTGDRAALLLPAGLPVNALAMDWPWRGPRRMPAREIVRRMPEIRSVLLRTPSVLALGVDAAVREREVDQNRVTILGASLGVPPAVASLRLTNVPRALVLIDGGADLARMLEAGLRRERVPDWIATPLGALAARLLHPLEPSLHREVGTDRRVLIHNSRHDQQIPAASIALLHRIFPTAEIQWSNTPHLHPGEIGQIAARSRQVVEWLER